MAPWRAPDPQRPGDFGSWATRHLHSERFDPALWRVVRAGPEIVAGAICTAGTLQRSEHSVGLAVDAAGHTGAFRLYERVGMVPALGRGDVWEAAR